MSKWKKVLLLITLLAGATLTAVGGYGSRETIVLNHFLQILAGGFLLGVTVLGAICARRSPPSPPAPPTPPSTLTPKSGA